MVFRVPYLEVNGPSGTNLVPVWGVALLNVKVVSYLDFMMDEATLTFSNKPPYKASPPSGTKFNVKMGWSAATAVDKGTFALQRIHLSGTPEQGERVAYICRAGIFDEGLNKVDTQHFGQDTGDTTLGAVFRKLFKDTGKTVVIAPEIDGKPLPGGYLLRQNQTAADTATDLAQDNRAIWKVAGDKIIVLALDAGQSVTGQNLGSIIINHDALIVPATYEYDVEIEPRFSYSSVSVPWFDPGTGRLKTESSPALGGGGDPGGLPHPAASQDDAKAQADAYAAELGREEFSGLFVIPGGPTATAGAFVQTVGFCAKPSTCAAAGRPGASSRPPMSRTGRTAAARVAGAAAAAVAARAAEVARTCGMVDRARDAACRASGGVGARAAAIARRLGRTRTHRNIRPLPTGTRPKATGMAASVTRHRQGQASSNPAQERTDTHALGPRPGRD